MKMVAFLVHLLFCFVGVGLGDPYLYDTFSYEPGQILGVSKDTAGFTGDWGGGGGNPTQCTVLADSLDYPGVDTAVQQNSGAIQVIVPNFEGGRVGRYIDFDPNSTIMEYKNQDNNLGVSGKTIYISFLMKPSIRELFYAFELKRDRLDDPGAVLYIGNDKSGTTLQVCAFRDGNTDASNIGYHLNYLGDATTETELFVVRIDFQDDGDDVTVYRQPSLEAEPVKEPDLLNAGDLSFDAISFAAWVDPAGRMVQFDEICMGSSYNDVVRFYDKPTRAQIAAPADGIQDIPADQNITLSWTAGPFPDITGYDVYFSDNINTVIKCDDSAFKGSTTATSMVIDNLNTDTTYYWSYYRNHR